MLYKINTIAKLLNKDIRTVTKFLSNHNVKVLVEDGKKYVVKPELDRFLMELGFTFPLFKSLANENSFLAILISSSNKSLISTSVIHFSFGIVTGKQIGRAHV